jgi:hypothetical protein
MSQLVELVIDAKIKPTNLPSFNDIINQCPSLAKAQSISPNMSGARFSLVKESNDDAAYVWVKFGYSIMSEARTQHFVSQFLEDNANTTVRVPRVYLAFKCNHIGYIVMEYIDGTLCENSDAELLATAVQSLISIKSPTLQPGPIGGGSIRNPLFGMFSDSEKTYKSVKELQNHVNGVSFSFPLRLGCPPNDNSYFRF